MKLILWKLTPAAALLLALTLTAAMRITPVSRVHAQQRGDEEDDRSGARKLEGTWRVQVTLRNCQTGAELRPATPALLTFAQGGTLTGTTTVFPPAVRSPDHGYWRRSWGRTYTAVSEAFLFNLNPSLPLASTWIGTQRITQTIQLVDHNELNSTASVEFFGPDGNPIPGFPPTGCATAVARRME